MTVEPKLTYDVSLALAQGQREQQEDAVIADFPLGGDMGFAVLADGMGGHAAGDVASKIVVTEVFSELKLQSGDTERFEDNIPAILNDAVTVANNCVRYHTENNPGSAGMGATLVAPVLMGDRLYWISVGDSPLFLFRDGKLSQLNEDHSLAGQIDILVQKGLMAVEVAENHPDRHCLTSVLIGDQIPRIDCPLTPVTLREDDIVLVASDGIQFLDDVEIAGLIEEKAQDSSAEITRNLIGALDALDDPHQDNVSICVIKVAKTLEQSDGSDDHMADHNVESLFIDLDKDFDPEDEEEYAYSLPPNYIAASTRQRPANRMTVVARKTINGLSMLYHFRRPSENSA